MTLCPYLEEKRRTATCSSCILRTTVHSSYWPGLHPPLTQKYAFFSLLQEHFSKHVRVCYTTENLASFSVLNFSQSSDFPKFIVFVLTVICNFNLWEFSASESLLPFILIFIYLFIYLLLLLFVLPWHHHEDI